MVKYYNVWDEREWNGISRIIFKSETWESLLCEYVLVIGTYSQPTLPLGYQNLIGR
jgi:hypothetical protein